MVLFIFIIYGQLMSFVGFYNSLCKSQFSSIYMQALLHMMQCTGSGPITVSYIDVGSPQVNIPHVIYGVEQY